MRLSNTRSIEPPLGELLPNVPLVAPCEYHVVPSELPSRNLKGQVVTTAFDLTTVLVSPFIRQLATPGNTALTEGKI